MTYPSATSTHHLIADTHSKGVGFFSSIGVWCALAAHLVRNQSSTFMETCGTWELQGTKGQLVVLCPIVLSCSGRILHDPEP